MSDMQKEIVKGARAAIRSLADVDGVAVRDRLFEIGRWLIAAREVYEDETAFSAWLRDSVFSHLPERECGALARLSEFEPELRTLLHGSTLTSPSAIWEQYGAAAFAMRTESSEPTPMHSPEPVEEALSEPYADQLSWNPPRRSPQRSTKLTKLLGDDAEFLYGWFTPDAVKQAISPFASANRAAPMLRAVVATIKNGECCHAPVANARKFDIRMAFPHLPEQFALNFRAKSPPTLYKYWPKFTELNEICASRSEHFVTDEAPNGTYLLRTAEQELEIDRLAHQWWQTGTVPESISNVEAIERHTTVEEEQELVFFGSRVWSRNDATISYSEACNAYRLVVELYGMLKANRPNDKPGHAIKIRHYSKWVKRLSNPQLAANIMHRMATAIAQNPDAEHQVAAPPIDIQYGD